MKTNCLIDRDLILLHYGESPDGTTPEAAASHLAACASCRMRREQLAAELGRIPTMADPDPRVATRVAARVSERLHRRPGRLWLPSLGTAALAVLVLVVTFLARTPQPEVPRVIPAGAPTVAALGLDEEMPDIDFLEDLELIENLELLQQIEGG